MRNGQLLHATRDWRCKFTPPGGSGGIRVPPFCLTYSSEFGRSDKVMPSLNVRIFDDFVLDNPFWIASADFSHSIGGLGKLRGYQPAAVTLKTTAPKRMRQPGTAEYKYTRAVHVQQDPFLRHRRGEILSTFYCDGPPKTDYLSIKATEQLLKDARQLLPGAKIGISIFMEEDYAKIAGKLLELTDFSELNLKYAARPKDSPVASSFLDQQQHAIERVLVEISAFCEAFAAKPVFIKLTREFPWLRPSKELKGLAENIQHERQKGRQLGLIVANTRKSKIPADLSADYHKSDFPGELSGGILAGEYLYIETYNLVQSVFSEPALAGVPLVATGGITAVSKLVELIHAGAVAVQVYSALKAYGFSYYEELRENLDLLLERSGLGSYTELIHVMRATGAKEEWRKIRLHALDIPIKKSTSVKADIDSQRQHWLKEIAEGLCAQILRGYSDDDVVRRLAKLPKKFAIAQDLGLPSVNSSLPEDRSEGSPDTTVHITVTRASFGAHILVYLMCNQCKRYVEDVVASTGELLSSLTDGRRWDLAVITEAYVEEISTNQAEGGSQPVILGRLLTSEYKLHHFVESLAEVDEIFHFGGREAKWTLRNLESRGELRHIEEKSAIKTDQLINWLRHSRGSKAGFLAKDPLAAAYVSLARGSEVHVGWREKIDLYLLGSRAFCEREGSDGLRRIYRDIASSRQTAELLLPGGQLSKVLESEIRVTWAPYLSI